MRPAALLPALRGAAAASAAGRTYPTPLSLPAPALGCVSPRIRHPWPLGRACTRNASVSAGASAADSSRPPLPATETVSSTANPYVKHLARLGTSRSHRLATGAALVPGSDLVGELLGQQGSAAPRVLSLWLSPGTLPPPFLSASSARAPPTFTAPPAVLARIAGVESGSGLGAVAEVALPLEPGWWREEGGRKDRAEGRSTTTTSSSCPPSRLLALDGVQDPGNVGALARAAAALGWDGLILLPGCADPWSAKAVRAGRAVAGWRLPTVVVGGGAADAATRLRALADTAGLVVLAADASPPGAGGAATTTPAVPAGARGVCLVLGSEGQGLSPPVFAACDTTVAIPMPGGLESLNVGQAGTILMYALSDGVREGLMGRLYGT